MLIAVIVISLMLVFAALVVWHAWDHRADRVESARLLALQPDAPAVFHPDMVADLPEPARRFFNFAIAQGTPLLPVAKITMRGRFSLGDKETPRYMAMTARQVLAAPYGFVWKVAMRSGPMRFSGSDSGTWTRFWLAGVFPVARMGGSSDHARAAFGRYVAEAVFWSPAAVLPGPHVVWAPLGPDQAQVTVHHCGMTQSVDLTVAEDGRPVEVSFARWSNANADRTYRYQRFGGYLSVFRVFEGYRLPTHVEAGNFFGSDAYFPFFIVDVDTVVFPQAPGRRQRLRA